MPFTFTMPKLSPTMEEGTITKWRKKVGDLVKAGDVVIEVATDKATVEHSALDEGYLRKILVNEGQDALVNQAIAIFTEKADESIEGYVPEGLAPAAAPVAAPEKETEAEAPKTAPTTKPVAGAMQQPAFVPEPPLTHYEFPFPSGEAPERIAASPLARKLAKEEGIDLSTVKGSGPHGRIVSEDLKLGKPSAKMSFGRHDAPDIAPGTYEEEPLTPVRKLIGHRLQEAKTFIPHFYVTQEVNCESLIRTREELKSIGISVTFNDFIVRACALALREHPQVNSGYNSVNSSIIRFKTIDISVAVSVPAGLITPIVRHADYKNLSQISAEVKDLATRAKDGKLAREEYFGGSFTISNLGMFGISEFVAIINPPQAAILSIGGIETKPVVKDNQIVIGKTMRLTLSADHRVFDGAEGAKFIKTVQKYLEASSILVI